MTAAMIIMPMPTSHHTPREHKDSQPHVHHHPHNPQVQEERKKTQAWERSGLSSARVRESTDPASQPPSFGRSLSIIRARGSGSAGGVGGGTTGGNSLNSGGSSPHAPHPTTAATAATFLNSMGDWEELKRKVRGIESKLEVRSECARRQR